MNTKHIILLALLPVVGLLTMAQITRPGGGADSSAVDALSESLEALSGNDFVLGGATNANVVGLKQPVITGPPKKPTTEYEGGTISVDLDYADFTLVVTNETIEIAYINAPDTTGTAATWSGIVTNAFTNVATVQWGDASPTSLVPVTTLNTNDVYEFKLESRDNVLRYTYIGPQSEVLPKAIGGSGNIYGIADQPEYASPTLSLSSATNLFPDFSQGPLPHPLELSTNLFIAAPSGLTSSGRAVEIKLPLVNTNTGGTIRIDSDDDWTLYGFTNSYQELGATNSIVLTLRSYGTNPAIFLEGMSAAYSGGGSSPAWEPGVLYDMESDHSFTISGGGAYTALVSQQNTSSPHIGTKSLTVTTTNVAAYTVAIPLQTAASEVWIAGTMSISAAPAGTATWFELLTAGASYRAAGRMNTSRQLTVTASGGTYSSAHATAVPTSGNVYFKIHYVAGSGDAELYVTDDPSAGWGTPVTSTNGTGTDDVARFNFYNHTGAGSGRVYKYDQFIWSTEDIPASYFIGL